MCTVTWQTAPGGYDLFFNRDERHTRAAETEPHFGWAGDVAFLAPRDGDRGGTWLLVNDRGLTVGLLNDYACPWAPPAGTPRLSRGQVVLACAGATNLRDVAAAARRSPLETVPAFTLFAVAADGTAAIWRWRGARLVRARAADERTRGMLTSSSFATAEICTGRRRRFTAHVGNAPAVAAGTLREFHRRHDAARGAESVLMRRPDAATRSISHIAVRAGVATFEYAAVAWPAGGAAPELHPRRFNLELAADAPAR